MEKEVARGVLSKWFLEMPSTSRTLVSSVCRRSETLNQKFYSPIYFKDYKLLVNVWDVRDTSNARKFHRCVDVIDCDARPKRAISVRFNSPVYERTAYKHISVNPPYIECAYVRHGLILTEEFKLLNTSKKVASIVFNTDDGSYSISGFPDKTNVLAAISEGELRKNFYPFERRGAERTNDLANIWKDLSEFEFSKGLSMIGLKELMEEDYVEPRNMNQLTSKLLIRLYVGTMIRDYNKVLENGRDFHAFMYSVEQDANYFYNFGSRVLENVFDRSLRFAKNIDISSEEYIRLASTTFCDYSKETDRKMRKVLIKFESAFPKNCHQYLGNQDSCSKREHYLQIMRLARSGFSLKELLDLINSKIKRCECRRELGYNLCD